MRARTTDVHGAAGARRPDRPLPARPPRTLARGGGTWVGWKPRPATYGVARTTDVLITMSDGVRLDADVLRPAKADGTPAPGRFPVVLTQTPYNKNAPPQLRVGLSGRPAATCRSSSTSGGPAAAAGSGTPSGLGSSATGPSWCGGPRPGPGHGADGRVALHGTSYGAINQFLTAEQQPAGLKAMFPIVPMADTYRDIAATGGQVDTSFIPSWLGLVTATRPAPADLQRNRPVTAGGAGRSTRRALPRSRRAWC